MASASSSSSSSLNSGRPVSFSADSNYLAYSGADGRLRIWEASTGILKQEYTASSHLSAMCTCLSWVPRSSKESYDHQQLTAHVRKKKKGEKFATLSLDILAMGTAQGSILLYSVVKGDLVSELTGGHAETVNDLCWHTDSDSLFSCSEDRRIVQWSPSKGKVKSRFKLGLAPIYAIAALPDGETLLTAGKSIRWWNLAKRELLKKFTGHASRILQLGLVLFPDEPFEKGYVVSAAKGDRLISAWQLDSADKSALVSFLSSDDPASINVSRPTNRSQKLRLSVVTRGGVLHEFEHQLNGNVRKPLQPTTTLQMSLSDRKAEPTPIPVLSVHLCEDLDQNLLVAYGDLRKVGFEKLLHSSLKQHMCLVRSLSSFVSNNLDTRAASKVMTPTVSKGVKQLAPGHLMGSLPSQVDPGDDDKKSKRRKLDDVASGSGVNGGGVVEGKQLPMEDRLSALNLAIPSCSSRSVSHVVTAPQLDSMANLLLQGLHSRDESMMNRVFNETNRGAIENTVRRLPAQVVLVLLKELHRRIFEHPDQNPVLLWWLRALLTHHTSYLSTCTELNALVQPLYQLMDSRTVLFEKMSQLKGRMDLVVSQLNMKEETTVPRQKALCTYQDESSDETDSYIDELLPSMSELEADNWDEFSENEDVEHDDKIDEEEEEEEEQEEDDEDDSDSD